MEFNKFITFEELITPQAITIVYIIGAILITLGSLAFMGIGIVMPQYGSYSSSNPFSGGFLILFGLIYLIFGNLFWRMLCEFLIVIFKINDTLVSIKSKSP
jgi:hypothetical protein